MAVLLTGATGFVGRTVLLRLLQAGRRVRALVRDPRRLPAVLNAGDLLKVHHGSLTEPASLRGAAEGVESVVNVAGLVAARRCRDLYRVNRDGVTALAAEVAASAPEARWIQISSLAAAGPHAGPGNPQADRPVSDYGASKLAGEQALAAAGLENWMVLRPPAVYGPGDTAFLPYFRAVAGGRPVPVPAVEGQRLNFVHVADLAEAVVCALESASPPAGTVTYPAHPDPVRLDDFMREVAAAVGRRARVLRVPPRAVWWLAALAAPVRALTGRPKFLSLDKVPEIVAESWRCDPASAQRLLGWHARYDLPAGVADTVAAYRRDGLLKAAREAPSRSLA